MSLLATSYRYEITSCNAKQLQKAVEREHSRIKEDEKYADRYNQTESDARVNEVSKWSESLEEASERRRVKREVDEIKGEIRLGSKAMIMVRREKLRDCLRWNKKFSRKSC